MSNDDQRRENRHEITFTIDGHSFTSRDDDQEAAALLRLADRDPDDFDLALVKKNGEQKTLKDKQIVKLDDGDEFVTVTPSFGVIVNGQEKPVGSRTVTYDEIVRLAFPDKVGNADITFVVLFRRAKQQPKEGSLVDGGTVEIKKEGTIFNVTFTNRS